MRHSSIRLAGRAEISSTRMNVSEFGFARPSLSSFGSASHLGPDPISHQIHHIMLAKDPMPHLGPTFSDKRATQIHRPYPEDVERMGWTFKSSAF